ncbi:helix-turn-helix domain-containing protein [Sporolactobacillus shoreicorticis]|uniref:Helix-turn-helix domain-containing protein n=1 Tax=Sporolactobacillus shoreicorticis TaxID=1923877 RepID=A0ABW5S0D0_9BACL|nr:helix-turn-helix domain-containing protein [Sporolactobacillus shoreicorticis]MCO7127533.1 helix-turn-helix domain-containing protein [Sporolactobacillus shoreicorticis]
MNYIQNIKKLRQEYGFTQGELAGPGLSRSMISLIESGRSVPSLKTLEIIANKLGVSASVLLEDTSVRDSGERKIDLSLINEKITICQTLIKANKLLEAQTVLRKTLNETNDSVIYKGVLLNYQGQILIKQKEYCKAIDIFEESLFYFDPSKHMKNIIDVYLNLAQLYKKVGNYSEAIDRALYGHILTESKSIDLESSYKFNFLFVLAYCYCKKKEFLKGRQTISQALTMINTNEVNNINGDLYMLKGVSELYSNENIEAVKSCKRAIEIFEVYDNKKRIYECLLNLGIAYRKLNKLHQSYAAILNSFEIATNLDEVMHVQNIIYELSLTLYLLKEYDQSKEWIRKGLSIMPSNVEFDGMLKYQLSKIYLKEKNVLEAEKLILEALDCFNNDVHWQAQCLHHKADILHEKLDKENAFLAMKESSQLILAAAWR